MSEFMSLFLSFFPAGLICEIAGPEETKNRAGGGSSPPDSNPFGDREFGKNLGNLSNQFAASANRRFELKKRSQLFFATSDKPLSVVPMCVNNPVRSPLGINRRDTAPTPSGFAEIVSDDFLHTFTRFATKRLSRFRSDMPSLL
jgi:hypothetical protein